MRIKMTNERQIIGARTIPQQYVQLEDLHFRHVRGKWDVPDADKIEISNGNKSVVLDTREQGTGNSRIGVAQVLTLEDRIRIYVGTFSFRPATLLSYDFFKDRFSLEFRGKLETDTNTCGLLLDRNGKGIITGTNAKYQDVSRTKICFFDFTRGLLEELYSRPHEKLNYTACCLGFNPPQIQDGKFYVSHLDSEGNPLCDSPFSTQGLIRKDMQRILRDEGFGRAVEFCVDDEMEKRGHGEELASIKKDV
jgi:hypothetical protein